MDSSPPPPPPLARQLYSLAWPAFAENLLQTALGMVALMLVGRLGAETIAAVGLANQIFFVTVVVLMGWSIGTTALIARLTGAGDTTAAGGAARQSLILATAGSIVLAVILFPLARVTLVAAGANQTIADIGEPFLQVLILSTPGMGLSFAGSAALRGAGDTRTPMYVAGITNAINIVLAWAMVLGQFGLPALGAVGAALSVVIARSIAGAVTAVILLRRTRTDGRQPLVDLAVATRVARIGGPAAAEQLVVQVGFLAFNLTAIQIGTAEFAAMQISFNAAQVSQLAGMAFATAATTLVGQSLGAGRPDRARGAGWLATRSAVVWMVIVGVLFAAFADPIFRLYGSDERVIALGHISMIVMGIGQAPQAIAFVLSGALRGAGDTHSTLIGGMLGTVVLRAPLAYLIGVYLGFGFWGIWIAWLADWLARSAIFILRFRSSRWERVRV
jgi:putative MATE family efflux protein